MSTIKVQRIVKIIDDCEDSPIDFYIHMEAEAEVIAADRVDPESFAINDSTIIITKVEDDLGTVYPEGGSLWLCKSAYEQLVKIALDDTETPWEDA